MKWHLFFSHVRYKQDSGEDRGGLGETGRKAFTLTAVPQPSFLFSPHRLRHGWAGESGRGLSEVLGGSCGLCPLRIPTRNTRASFLLLSTPSSGTRSCFVYLSCRFPVIKVNHARPTFPPCSRFPLDMTCFPQHVPSARHHGPRPALFLEGVQRQSGPSRAFQRDNMRNKWRGL